MSVGCCLIEISDLAVECQYDEMGDLAVGSYEDGGAMPLGDVGRQERAIKDNYLQITFTFNAKTSSEIL